MIIEYSPTLKLQIEEEQFKKWSILEIELYLPVEILMNMHIIGLLHYLGKFSIWYEKA